MFAVLHVQLPGGRPPAQKVPGRCTVPVFGLINDFRDPDLRFPIQVVDLLSDVLRQYALSSFKP